MKSGRTQSFVRDVDILYQAGRVGGLTDRELLEEINRLPSADRRAVVLCYFEGMTQESAACELGWTKGTVSGRLCAPRTCSAPGCRCFVAEF